MRKIPSFFLLIVVTISLVACKTTEIIPENKPEVVINNVANVGFNDYSSNLINFINKTHGDKNYSVSPISLKYALALAAYGAEGETREELLRALGVKNMDELELWISGVGKELNYFKTSAAYKSEDLKLELDAMKEYLSDSEKEDYEKAAEEDILEIANSVWHNAGSPGEIKKEYIQKVESVLKAKANNVDAEDMEKEINAWVNNKTRGLIPLIVDNTIQRSNTVLVNTVYMKNTWANKFEECETQEMDFTAIDGSVVQKDVMHQRNNFEYYEDENSKVLIMPMEHNIGFAFVLGENANINDKIAKAKREDVDVYIPKFDIDTSFENDEMLDFLKANGVEAAFSGEKADFSNMIDLVGVAIDKVIQKTKVKIDEDGAEAAAATVITMKYEAAIEIELQKPKEFKADKPFSFYVYIDGETEDYLLFYGQIVR